MNKKGFTLIEILAVIIIIGIVSTIGISAVSDNIRKSRDNAFADLAIKYGDSARSMRGQDKLYYDPKDGEALLIKINGLTGVDQDDNYNTGFGEVDLDYSYVIVTNNKYKYNYYVTLVDDTKHALIAKEVSSIKDKDVINIENYSSVLNVRVATVGSKVKVAEATYTVKKVQDKYMILTKN